jgi:antirestriction protein ArdC
MTDMKDVYSRITNKIIADLEQGVRPWLRPWNAEHAAGRITRPLRYNGIPYKGINVVMLWSAAVAKGYACPLWLTFKQALELGGNVRKGEKGELVVYANSITRAGTNDKGEEVEREIPFLKGYTVFNAEQCEGLPAQYYARAEPPALTTLQRCDAADRFFAATGADIRHGGTRAYYAEGSDYVQMPPFETFRDAEGYAATLAHEICHWTKHDKRLARDFGRSQFGDEGYAKEELAAELGSAFLCADLGITPEVRDDHAAYIASWLKVLKGEKRFVFTAASHAQRAVDYLHSLQPKVEDEPPASSDEMRPMFKNHYACPRCKGEWTDTWPHQVDDDCPHCGARHIAPYRSDDAEERAAA